MKQINIDLPVKSNNFKLVVLGDLHIGDNNCDLDLIRKTINFVKETKDCYCIINGDIINNALKDSKSDIYTESMSIYEEQLLAVKLLNPIKDKILAIATGNHENRTWRVAGIDPTYFIASELELKDKYCDNSYLVSVTFGLKHGRSKYRYNIFGIHGAYGGGRRLGSPANAMEDMSKVVCNADLYIRSHTHQSLFTSENAFEVNQNGNLKEITKVYYNANAFLHYGGYAEQKGYKPSDRTPGVICIKAYTKQISKSKEEDRFITDLVRI